MTQHQNVDNNEIKKFAAAADIWWQTDGELKTLHDINPIRMAFICDKVELAEKNVIDVGCGGGILTESLARAGANVTGIDMANEVLQIARDHAQKSSLNIDYQLTPVETIAESHAEQYDVITCMEMLEHVPNPVDVINACARLAKPGGKLFFSTLNRNLKSYVLAILGAEYILKLIPKGTHEYSKFIKPAELEAWARAAGLTLNTLAGIEYNPLTKTCRLTNNVSVNYLAYFIKQDDALSITFNCRF